jgi:hypothetical protein
MSEAMKRVLIVVTLCAAAPLVRADEFAEPRRQVLALGELT